MNGYIVQAEIKKSNSVTEFDTPERCYIKEISNDNNDEQVSIAQARVEPGVTTAWHKLKAVTERYIIVKGQARVEIAGLEPTDVVEGDVVIIPADTAQRISNTGQTDLIFYAVCSPCFTPECYITL